MEKLDQSKIDELLAAHPDWAQVGDALQRTCRFDDFLGAMAFVSQIADLAESLQHHPDIMIRYSKVTLTLTTHDEGGITDRDLEFVQAVDQKTPVA